MGVGIVPDNRSPGYACGPFWGMLGPSRMWVSVPSGTGGWFAGKQLIVPISTMTLVTDIPYQAHWDGKAGDDGIAGVLLSSGDPFDGLGVIQISLVTPDPAFTGFWQFSDPMFAWSKNTFTLVNSFPGGEASLQARRVSEWVDTDEAFPSALILEDV